MRWRKKNDFELVRQAASELIKQLLLMSAERQETNVAATDGDEVDASPDLQPES
jgi:hypothetical protein